MKQQPLFLKSGNTQLYGVNFTPETDSLGTVSPEKVFLFCHPLFEEKKASHRVLVELARELSENNCAVLMLDFSTCGDSEGEIKDFNPIKWQADIQSGIDYLNQAYNKPEITLLGIRFGATIATISATKNREIKDLILIDPVIKGERYLNEVLQQKFIREMMTFGESKSDKNSFFADLKKNAEIDIDGIMISDDFVEEIKAINLDEVELEGLKNIFLIQQSPKRTLLPVYGELQKKCETQQINLDLELIQCPPFWKAVDMADFETVCRAIIKWKNQ
jgi:exosortase A-associated hydrolase 2